MSVTDWLFPDRVGPKRKAHHALPIGGEFVVDVDSYLARYLHRHIVSPVSLVCADCLEASKHLTLDLCDRILENYSRIGIIFSGRRGFHIAS